MIRPSGLVLDGAYGTILLVTNAIVIVIGGAHAARLGQLNGAYERELLSQRWHYKQRIPKVA